MSGAISVHHGEFGRAALYDLNKSIITHAHREAHLVFYIDGSPASVTVRDDMVVTNRKYGAAISPWQPHSFDLINPDETCLCLVLYIKPIWFLENTKFAQHAISFGESKIEITKSISEWVTRLTSLLMDNETSELFDGFLFETTRLCYEQSWVRKSQRKQRPSHQYKCVDFRVRRSLRLMQESFSGDMETDMEMERIAKRAGLSRPHFFKLFKKQMGITPNLYLSTLRTEQAIEDLMTTNKSVTDISFDLGFSSQASFTRFFSSNVGIPPSDYRRVAHVV